MKSLLKISVSVICVLGSLSSVALAKPLTLGDIKSAKKIGIMPGSFDPITQGHVAAATAAIEKAGVDLVIMVPMENPHKQPIARTERLKMIELAMVSDEKIAYAKEGGDFYALISEKKIWNIVEEMRKLNPAAEIDLVAGSDFDSNTVTTAAFTATTRPDRWVVINRPGEDANLSKVVLDQPHVIVDAAPMAQNVSSSNAKKYLESHLELYQEAPSDILVATVPGIELEVERYIIAHQLYKEATKPSMFQRFLDKFWKP